MNLKRLPMMAHAFVGPLYPDRIDQLNALLRSDEGTITITKQIVRHAQLTCYTGRSPISFYGRTWFRAMWFQTETGIVIVLFPYCSGASQQKGNTTGYSVACYSLVWSEGPLDLNAQHEETDMVIAEILKAVMN